MENDGNLSVVRVKKQQHTEFTYESDDLPFIVVPDIEHHNSQLLYTGVQNKINRSFLCYCIIKIRHSL